MKLKNIKIKNFRSYKNETLIYFNDFTAFIGKNDIGKSSILDALDIFFNDNKGVVKLDKGDINREALSEGDNEICISVCFEDLPHQICIDATNETSLQQEYLVQSDGLLEIMKKYPNAGSAKVYIKANHPQNVKCNKLLEKKNTDLRKIIEEEGIYCSDKTKNAVMRQSIWKHYEQEDLQLGLVELDVLKSDAKSIWEKLQCYLPVYSLFQADRKNSDGDSEVQDPLKEAVKEILKDEEIISELTDVASKVKKTLEKVAGKTLEKLNEMNPEIASTLKPDIPLTENLKWADVFKNVSITGDQNIPINKRGSGVRRLILLNFFRAEAEHRLEISGGITTNVIYAIEEPETSQHTENQKKLIRALTSLASSQSKVQIIITTHSPNIVKELKFSNLRLISPSTILGQKEISEVSPNCLPYPSLEEVNFLAFSEITEGYHDELYGFIEEKEILNCFFNWCYSKGEKQRKYIKQFPNGSTKEYQKYLTQVVRDQIHHPENHLNQPYTEEELKQSIGLMRNFIQEIMV